MRSGIEERLGECVRGHLSDHDLERYHLGMVQEPELTGLEDHLIGCPRCALRAEESASYVDAMRSAIVKGNFDIE